VTHAGPGGSAPGALLSADLAAAFARRALANIAREYPNQPHYLLESPADLVRPRVAHPSFFGCFDWHSAVHTHWLLVRLLNVRGEHVPRESIEAALTASLEPANTIVEAAYLGRHPAFERPYGLAWLALLHAEIAASASARAPRWAGALAPVAAAARANVAAWLERLRYPVRSGTHNQTAFALGLLLDAARTVGDAEWRSVCATQRCASTRTTSTRRSATSRRARISCRRASWKRTSCAAS
jgi:hypothetical protein